MKGKLIVLEGTDCSGKSTQFQRLCTYFEAQKIPYRKLVFPRYAEESSALIRMYLNGEFGASPSDVSPYTASVFFAVDRYASFMKDWKSFYQEGGIVLSDRYTTSNAIHQGSKLSGDARNAFIRWLFEFEYGLMGLPNPDLVLFLDMPTKYAVTLLASREGKTTDIHENDLEYLETCYNTALQLQQAYGWSAISCVEKNSIRPIEKISRDIISVVEGILHD